MRKFFKNFFITAIVITLLLVANINVAVMQSAESNEGITSTMNQLKVYHSGFLAVRNEFFADQSAGNKARYHKAGQDWTIHLIEANLQYLDYMQTDLYNQLVDKSGLTPNWLKADHDLLDSYKDKVNNSQDYVNLRNLMSEYAADWENALQKINHVKVLIYLNQVNSLIIQALQIHDSLETQQQSVRQALADSGVTDVDMSVFDQVLVTYSNKLTALEDLLKQAKGDINSPRQFTFTAEDKAWQEVLSQVDNINKELKPLSTLQENSIAQFINILNTDIKPN